MIRRQVSDSFHSGYVSLIGRPNVGKSSLLNVLLGQKIAIVSEKPQTTRNRIAGILTSENAQIIFIDTPGIHKPQHKLGESMVRTAMDALREIDIVLFVAEADRGISRDRVVLKTLEKFKRPVFLLINKIDLIKKKELLPVIESYRNLYPFQEIIPVSAIKQTGITVLIDNIIKYLSEGPRYYPEDTFTDQLERSIAAEIIREKIMDRTSDEIPYSVAVEIVKWTEREDGVIFIHANIYVERAGQKGIIIGEKGKTLKTIGTMARLDMEKLLDAKVFLELWVKVKKGWRDNQSMLRELGYI